MLLAGFWYTYTFLSGGGVQNLYLSSGQNLVPTCTPATTGSDSVMIWIVHAEARQSKITVGVLQLDDIPLVVI